MEKHRVQTVHRNNFICLLGPAFKEDFVEMANCFSVELMPESMRQALISLLFKKEDFPISQERPIALLNTDDKIITKVLVNRVKPVMPMIIHPDLCCSVPGRSCEDNATPLRDVCDYLVEVNERMACVFISIEQEKAFDYVDWGF
jgi:hypothetical protein